MDKIQIFVLIFLRMDPVTNKLMSSSKYKKNMHFIFQYNDTRKLVQKLI